MRTRLRRRMFSYVCGLSLLAFAGTVVLWVRSYSDTDCVQYATDTSYAAILSSRGRLLLRFDAIPQSAPTRFPPQALGTQYWNQSPPANPADYQPQRISWRWKLFGFDFQKGQWLDASRHIAVLPCWFVALATAGLPIRWAMLRRGRWRRERDAEGKTCRCGYSLTGNTSGTCPECGVRIPNNPD